MRLEQLYSLNDDELAMLWYAINKTEPSIIKDVEIDVELFCAIKHTSIVDRINKIESLVKDEYKEIFNSLKSKLEIASTI